MYFQDIFLRSKMWWKTAPTSGQLKNMDKHGKLHKWCKHCKMWTYGEKIHSSGEHVVRSSIQENSGQSGDRNSGSGPSNGQNGGSSGQSGAATGIGNMAHPGRDLSGLIQCGNLFKSSGFIVK